MLLLVYSFLIYHVEPSFPVRDFRRLFERRFLDFIVLVDEFCACLIAAHFLVCN